MAPTSPDVPKSDLRVLQDEVQVAAQMRPKLRGMQAIWDEGQCAARVSPRISRIGTDAISGHPWSAAKSVVHMNPLFNLTGRTALITGSSQGIGFALARGLAQAGASVVLNGRDETKLEAAADALRAEVAGARVATAAFDVTDAAAIGREVARLEADFAPIDILINNAGIQRRAPLAEMTEAQGREVLDTNLTSVFLVARAVAPRMIARGAGKIINTCSVMSEVSRPTIANYAAAKGGLKMLTRAMAVEWAKHGLQCNGLGPGYIVTELNRALVENVEFNKWICGRTPAGRWGQPEELVGAAVFLASPASNFVNGQILYVDGGLLAAL